jgi:glycyl-tRNA synthetase alpha chain
LKSKVKHEETKVGLNFQDLILFLQRFWLAEGCVLQQPYDAEVGAGTMHPETFLRVLGPTPYRVAYVQPSRRPADGRYGENPNRLYKHTQFQVILKPAPADIQSIYLGSLRGIGIDLRHHDVRFEEDNWEAPTLGAWGIGWQVLLDGLEITQFTYFQQCGGLDLEPVSVELTYGLERICAFLQGVESVYGIRWNDQLTYGQVRLAEEEQFSAYSFGDGLGDKGAESAARLRTMLDANEGEAKRLIELYRKRAKQKDFTAQERRRFPILAAYDCCLKCSNLFNLLDARGVISTTERAALIGRIRQIACGVAQCYLDQTKIRAGEAVDAAEGEPA